MASDLLQHLTEVQVRHELRGFPSSAVDAVLKLKRSRHSALQDLQCAILQILAFYLPKGTDQDLSARPVSARLREDLGVDSLTFSEAAFKLEELFNVRIENAELAQIKTVGDLTQFAQEKLLPRPSEVA